MKREREEEGGKERKEKGKKGKREGKSDRDINAYMKKTWKTKEGLNSKY